LAASLWVTEITSWPKRRNSSGPRLHAALLIADLEHDAAGLRLNRDFLAGDLVEMMYSPAKMRRGLALEFWRVPGQRRFHPAKALLSTLKISNGGNHGWFEVVSEHTLGLYVLSSAAHGAPESRAAKKGTKIPGAALVTTAQAGANCPRHRASSVGIPIKPRRAPELKREANQN